MKTGQLEDALEQREVDWDMAYWSACAQDKPTPECPDDIKQWVRVKQDRDAWCAIKKMWQERSEDYTFRDAIMVTLAFALDRWSRNSDYEHGQTMAHFNGYQDGYGWACETLIYYHKSFTFGLGSDGDSFY